MRGSFRSFLCCWNIFPHYWDYSTVKRVTNTFKIARNISNNILFSWWNRFFFLLFYVCSNLFLPSKLGSWERLSISQTSWCNLSTIPISSQNFGKIVKTVENELCLAFYNNFVVRVFSVLQKLCQTFLNEIRFSFPFHPLFPKRGDQLKV